MLNFPKIASLTDPSKRKMALAQFEHTAMELATNKAGVTPLVVQVCNETAELLEDTVMSAIESEHDTDQAMINTAFARFATVEEQRLEYETLILAAVEAVSGAGGLIEQHVACRTFESQQCVTCGTCRNDCDDFEATCDLKEAELRIKYVDVINTVTEPAYCDAQGNIHPPNSETVVTLAEHADNKEKMEAYLRALEEFTNCEEDEDDHCNTCPDDPTTCNLGLDSCPCLNHTHTRVECNTLQQAMQHAQCEARHTVSGYMGLYEQAFRIAANQYQTVETQVRIMEADRKVEWDTLDRVICLLMTLTIDEDGSASSVQTANAIAECRSRDVDTTHLDITYYEPPVLGQLPALPHSPCSDEFATEAYLGVPAACAGNEELQEQYEHGLMTECECTAQPPVPSDHGFPYALGPFMMFDTGFALNSADGFQVNEGMDAWEAVFEGTTYSGRTSPFAAVTMPDLDEAFGLSGDDVVASVAWAYPDPAGTSDMIARHSSYHLISENRKCPRDHEDRLFRLPVSGSSSVTIEECHTQCQQSEGCSFFSHGTWEGGFVCMGCTRSVNSQAQAGISIYDMSSAYPEVMRHRFIRAGGFVYLNAANQAVAVKELSESTTTLSAAQHGQVTMYFDGPQGITSDQAQHACPGGFHEVTDQAHLAGGGMEYCWDKSGTLSFCTHGCFTFKMDGVDGLGYLAFPLIESTAHLAPSHYAPTDQQGATIVSMETGTLAASVPEPGA